MWDKGLSCIEQELDFNLNIVGIRTPPTPPPVVKTTPYLGAPVIPAGTVRKRGVAYSTYGFLKPRHKAGTRTIQLVTARLVGKKWVAGPTFKPVNHNYYSSYTRYLLKIKLGTAGRWRIRAVSPADSLHKRVISAWKYFTVR